MARTIVLAWGNPSRGDDALGPLFAEGLSDWLADGSALGDCIVVEDFQLQIEHAADLVDCARALFVDASLGQGPAYRFSRLEPRRDSSHTTHALTPEAVLAVFAQVYGSEPPPAYLLAITGESFELGEALSEGARRNLAAALALARGLLADDDLAAWDALAGRAFSDRRGPESSYA